MAKFEDMLFELAMDSGKGSMWAEELRRKAIGFEPPRIADGVGGLSVPSITAGEIDVAQLTHLNASAFQRTTEQTISNLAYNAISWTGDKYKRSQKPILKVHSTPTKIDVSGWKWPNSLALVVGNALFAANATGVRVFRLAAYDSGDNLLESWWSSSAPGDAVIGGICVFAQPVELPAGCTYMQVEALQNSGGDLGLSVAHFGAIRIL